MSSFQADNTICASFCGPSLVDPAVCLERPNKKKTTKVDRPCGMKRIAVDYTAIVLVCYTTKPTTRSFDLQNACKLEEVVRVLLYERLIIGRPMKSPHLIGLVTKSSQNLAI